MLDCALGPRYTPVTFQGRPQQVSYVFNFKLKHAATE